MTNRELMDAYVREMIADGAMPAGSRVDTYQGWKKAGYHVIKGQRSEVRLPLMFRTSYKKKSFYQKDAAVFEGWQVASDETGKTWDEEHCSSGRIAALDRYFDDEGYMILDEIA